MKIFGGLCWFWEINVPFNTCENINGKNVNRVWGEKKREHNLYFIQADLEW